MKFIEHTELDKVKWDKLVSENDLNPFSFSWYLDACASNWCVLIDDDWKNGIALAYTSHLGIENLSPALFGRTLDFIGNDSSFQNHALVKIKNRFKVGQLRTSKPIPSLAEKTKIHQVIETEMNLGSQAKRMLKKAQNSKLIIQETKDWQGILAIAEQELSSKISEFNPQNLKRLRNLAQALSVAGKLFCFGIFENGELKGGMLFIKSEKINLYLKGSALPETKKNGGMYLCMHDFISQTLAENKTFDFGGSSVPGVQRFNNNFGGTDALYYVYEWDDAPWYYQIVKKMYHLIKR